MMNPLDEYLRRAWAHRTRKAGTHQDRRDKRVRTRGAAARRAINNSNEEK